MSPSHDTFYEISLIRKLWRNSYKIKTAMLIKLLHVLAFNIRFLFAFILFLHETKKKERWKKRARSVEGINGHVIHNLNICVTVLTASGDWRHSCCIHCNVVIFIYSFHRACIKIVLFKFLGCCRGPISYGLGSMPTVVVNGPHPPHQGVKGIPNVIYQFTSKYHR